MDDDPDGDAVRAEYVLPLRWGQEQSTRAADALVTYLRGLPWWVDVTVVDGSAPAVFARHVVILRSVARHVPPDPPPTPNGKVAGVLTGVRIARHEHVVVADDDVRYGEAELRTVVAALRDADLVRPQNVFSSYPWHARWDTGRTLLNRCLGADHPGTCALRRSTFLAMGGYAGDVLFENLELARTVRAHGGVVVDRPDTYVPRLPPTTAHFCSQRVRQAYDSAAQPGRVAAELMILPAIGLCLLMAPWTSVVMAAVAVGAAEVGRRRHGGGDVFPRTSAVWALPWLLERGVTAWVALGARARGGVRYGDGRVRCAARSVRALRASASAPFDSRPAAFRLER
ncbi:glycosyltransferase [Phycicoccus sp. 3266]|jgi:hypothetical protein|uniref:glycosyltransferase n=1 Tax=Phycicoccus sp. 3266 TaxID=2817751 RepID=UPI00285E63FB|nr:glycosyltransferase [Phycicoccus sp. 3266]MDR6864732.1 hypothetical protein [Phycicoccus sp. 3266]